MFSVAEVMAPVRAEGERDTPKPLAKVLQNRDAGWTFGTDEARERVIPGSTGLISRIDDQLGILFDVMERRGLMEETMIVVTSDNGDCLGDHWIGDKG